MVPMQPVPSATLFARAFAALAAEGDVEGVAILAEASLALARGEALQRRQRYDPTRRSTATSSGARSRPGSCSRPPASSVEGGATTGRLLGVSFQIVDDILDCAGDTIETGKIPGTDLRDGTRPCL